MFDFTLLRYSEFTRWPDDPEVLIHESDEFFYRQKIDPERAAYTKGVQIIRPSRPRSRIFASIGSGGWRSEDRGYCEFIAQDWRNDRITTISTHPSATTNYFDALKNSLPFDTSPAFFRPEVLLRYKTDRDKYTINEEHRFVSCRGGWELEAYDINEAGQVHAYLCYLRNLPHEEQLYWRSFNERPRASISERAFLNDFEGEPSDAIVPLMALLSIVRHWSESDLDWWQLADSTLLERVNTPVTNSREEWAQAFVDLANLVIQGFPVRAIRARLKAKGIPFATDARSLVLLEKILSAHYTTPDKTRLDGLRTVQRIRSKVGAHFGGSEATELAREAISDYRSYRAHFEAICNDVIREFELIEKALSAPSTL